MKCMYMLIDIFFFDKFIIKEYTKIGPTEETALGNKEVEISPSLTIVGKEEANINDFSTWYTHYFEPNTEVELAFRNYGRWTMGNVKVKSMITCLRFIKIMKV